MLLTPPVGYLIHANLAGILYRLFPTLEQRVASKELVACHRAILQACGSALSKSLRAVLDQCVLDY